MMVSCGSCGGREFGDRRGKFRQGRPAKGVKRQPILRRYRPALDPATDGGDRHVLQEKLHGCRSAGVLDDLIMSSHVLNYAFCLTPVKHQMRNADA